MGCYLSVYLYICRLCVSFPFPCYRREWRKERSLGPASICPLPPLLRRGGSSTVCGRTRFVDGSTAATVLGPWGLPFAGLQPPHCGDGEDWMQGSRKIGGPELTSRLRCRRSAEFIPDCEPQRLSGIGSICSLCAREASSAWVLCFHLRAPAIDWSTVW